MTLVSPSQSNPGDEIKAANVNDPVNQIAAVVNGNIDNTNISSVSGAKVQAGTINASAMDTATNVETRLSESLGNFVASGCVWSAISGLNGTMTAGVVYINGKRIVVAAITSQAFVASKDTYVSIDVNGTVGIANAVANNAASPTLPANSVWLAIVVTSGSAITSVNTGQIDAVAPVVSSRTLNICDTNGVLIYPYANQKLIGFARINTTFSTGPEADIPGLSTPVAIGAIGRKVKVSVYFPQMYNSVDSTRTQSFIHEDGSQVQAQYNRTWTTANGGNGAINMLVVRTPNTGLHTYKARMSTLSGTASMYADTNSAAFISVERE
ncbi:hypothetical protein [Arthrobacter cavernae]|uniref:Uncharacterized protein n=1 Tax=Arthrobacter cavernae TaxID=2817681 RepID=A0A939HGK3_9MICC|nr:hypothetical protein [Arthrobacter cavernae]MBO1267095.1 hypothetical protein [Arthrobacter cavernae]